MRKLTNLPPLLIGEYDYLLPDERIAKYPLEQRDASRLLVYKNRQIQSDVFRNAGRYLSGNSLLVYNNTRVIQARIIFRKPTGARIEVFCLEPADPVDYALSLGATGTCSWHCMIGNLKKWKDGTLTRHFQLDNRTVQLTATRIEKDKESDSTTHSIRFEWDARDLCFADLLELNGELPIPPYLNRSTEEQDLVSYQTVYSKIKGSVAAPTAGLHFTDEVLNELKSKGIETAELTLHVGAGTFQPVKTDDVADHQMHTEVLSVRKSTLEQLIDHQGTIIAVGTTSVRTLESLFYIGIHLLYPDKYREVFTVGQWEPYQDLPDVSTEDSLRAIIDYLEKNQLTSLQAQTQILIRPGFDFRLISGMFTNFHQPKSTLLLLVSAFVGEDWKKIYHFAMDEGFRFLSYGDSSLLLR